ncbi:PAS domain-containing sensor histidine kinase [Cephaloticoccus primus]|uniref:histidine kinase n=1 Tax=Cephaloticoccus primus TaxID=1548207 RepID=A0A139SS15_9BACT|nr:ATP-binding protein [Cephaloticoccus primus]KXU37337.1 PAS domain-containing sensor histidine kinase [Cephaloticoccus primus]
MPPIKHSSLDRVLGRIDMLDSVNLTNLVQRLARERSLFEGIFNTLQEGVLVISPSGEIEYANAAAHQLLGQADDSLLGKELWRLVPGLQASLGIEVAAEASSSPPQAGEAGAAALPVMTREFELSYPEPRTVQLYLVPFADQHAGAPRSTVILTDITRTKQSTEERIENERTSSILLLAAGVAHELGNPLNSLTIHLQLINRKLRRLAGEAPAAREVDAVADSIRICEAEVKRLDGIITHFLEAIRPQPPDLRETNLGELLAEVLAFQQRELADREIEVEAETSAGLAPVMADRNQVTQVFFNVIKNAVEAMPPGGHLRIKTHADDEAVYLAFADSGAGIKQEDLTRLFQPYHTTKAGGHGLGLMVVQRIMREHGGQIGIESKEGLGTVVTLRFPRKDRRIRMLAP